MALTRWFAIRAFIISERGLIKMKDIWHTHSHNRLLIISYLFLQFVFVQSLRESIAEHKPLIYRLGMLAKRLSDLSPDHAQQFCQKATEAEEHYQTIRDRVREAAGVLEESLPRYTQVIYCTQKSTYSFLYCTHEHWIYKSSRHKSISIFNSL